MKLYAPAYYPSFACIADQCTHSCCIGWEIDVDEDTYDFYQTLQGDYAKEIRCSMEGSDPPHFSLTGDERCPHLDERGLCRIITAYGHDALCEICREHPRFYHQTPRGMEVGLGLCCQEACRIVLSSDDFDQMLPIGELDTSPDAQAFDALDMRGQVYDLLRAPDLSHKDKLQRISDTFSVSPAHASDQAWCALLNSLEYLDESHRALFAAYRSSFATPPEQAPLLVRALAYFVFRHCSDADDAQDFRARLGLALLLERLLCSLITSGQDPYEAARILSEEIEYSEDNTDTLRSAFEEVCL